MEDEKQTQDNLQSPNCSYYGLPYDFDYHMDEKHLDEETLNPYFVKNQ